MITKDDRYFFGGNREIVIQRDGERCVKCGFTRDEHKERYGKDITVDHIDRRGKNVPTGQKNNALSNLQTLCLPCHGKKSYMDNGLRQVHMVCHLCTLIKNVGAMSVVLRGLHI